MFKPIIFILFAISSVVWAKSAEPDTTSARIYFAFNSSNLLPAAKLILNDVPPRDSSITLTGIKIYSKALATEKNTNIAIKRANNIKKYLIQLGIQPTIISANAAIDTANNKTANNEVMITLMIHYDAAVIERTIIIRPSVKQTDEMNENN
ncbi:OmpA family protein [Hydrotalea sp.]|uniref:OmpA family protein n=1 Tax=Hydrotalea sp. TaxID=2881279 RepID=UPI002604CE08|nr:OmpA family protein [Hydrotalea sp.]